MYIINITFRSLCRPKLQLCVASRYRAVYDNLQNMFGHFAMNLLNQVHLLVIWAH